MFSPKKTDSKLDMPDYQHATNANAGSGTVIARGVRVQGDFTSQSDVLIDGTVEGHVSTTAQLSVGSEAKLKADVTANDAIISGSIEGTLTVKRRLELKSTASVMGDITCETASIEAGAVVQGKVSIGGARASSSVASSAASISTMKVAEPTPKV